MPNSIQPTASRQERCRFYFLSIRVAGIILFAIMTSTLGAGCQTAPKYEAAASKETVLERMNVQQDNVDHVRWYRHKSSNQQLLANSWMEIYIGQEMNSPNRVWLRLRIYWQGKNWRFFDGITINADGVRHDWNNLNFKRDLVGSYGWVKETVDIPIDSSGLAVMQSIVKSQNAVIRLRGERGNWDIAPDANDRLIYQDVLTVFEKLQTQTD